MNKTYQEVCDELELAYQRIEELEGELQLERDLAVRRCATAVNSLVECKGVMHRQDAELQSAVSKARRELVNMIEWPPARHQAEQARQRLEFDEECRKAKRKGVA